MQIAVAAGALTAAVGGAIVTAFMAPYAAGAMIDMAVPAGTSIIPMFGHYIPSVFVSKAIELGVAGVSGLNLFLVRFDKLSLLFQ